MQIGLISPEFPPQVGGIQTYSFNIAKELVRRGHDVTVFSVPTIEKEELSYCNFRILRNLRLCRSLDLSMLRKSHLDVFHCTNASYSWMAKEIKQVVVSVHGQDFFNPYFLVTGFKMRTIPSARFNLLINKWMTKSLIKRSLPYACHIFANSYYTQQRLLTLCPACSGKTSVAGVGISEEFLNSKEKHRNVGKSIKFITVARLSERTKNIELVLKALASIKNDFNFTYNVVGEGDQSSLIKLTANLGLEQRVSFTGKVDQIFLRKLLSDSDLFIMVTSSDRENFEGFGIVYLEANACGTPTLALRDAGAIEAVKEGVSGFFIEKPEVELLTIAIKKFMSREITFSAESCQDFARQFTWAKVVDHFLEHYPCT